MDWRSFFPEATPRDIQTQILDFVTENFDEADAFFIEAPAGVGKSAIAVTLARWLEAKTRLADKFRCGNEARSYITTTTVALEDQYMRSYRSRGLVQLHSAAHYTCLRPRPKKPEEILTCEEGNELRKILDKPCREELPCPYKAAKERFIDNGYGIANAHYLLTESIHVGQLGTRGLLITDEGHTLAETICSLLELRLTERRVTSLGLSYPRIPEEAGEVGKLLRWVETEYRPALAKKASALNGAIAKTKESDLLLGYTRELKEVASELWKVKEIATTVTETGWVLERGVGAKSGEYMTLTPLSASGFSREMLAGIAPKLVLLSATLIDLDYHASELGVDPLRLGTFQAPSPFPKENRPIYASPRVRLDHRNLAATAAEAAHYIAPIVDGYPGQRGIIFTSSYSQARAIVEAVNALTRENRLSTHDGAAGKNLLLKMHENRPDSVLVSPSMHEGVDLKDDLSRFQIVTKLPFPSLGSKIVQGRMRVSPTWYDYTTVLKLIQATGRSIRTETDTAATYILDEAFRWFYKRNKKLFPGYWQEAVQFI